MSLLGDILNEKGKIESFETLQKRYNIKCNILDYYRIKLSVQNFVKKFSFEESFNYSRPSCPFHLRIFFKSSKGVKDFYQIFLSNLGCRPVAQIKWQSLANVKISNYWSVIYKICFKSTYNNSYVWFQYKTINNILDTNYYLQKVKMLESNQCRLCNGNPETITHLFSECRETLWMNVEYWILTRTGTNIKFDTTMEILGYHKYDSNFWPVNFILITVKYYIFKCSKQKKLYIFQV